MRASLAPATDIRHGGTDGSYRNREDGYQFNSRAFVERKK